MTPDEEINKLEDDIRRLKIEYEIYFNGGAPRPPHDTLFRVETAIKRYSGDQSKLNFGQRFRFNHLLQNYAVHSQLWRRRLQDKEEGRSPIAVLKRSTELPVYDATVRVVCSDPEKEPDKVEFLLHAMLEARARVGETAPSISADNFRKFIAEKTRQVKQTLGCDKVEFSVSIEEGKVKFKAAKAE